MEVTSPRRPSLDNAAWRDRCNRRPSCTGRTRRRRRSDSARRTERSWCTGRTCPGPCRTGSPCRRSRRRRGTGRTRTGRRCSVASKRSIRYPRYSRSCTRGHGRRSVRRQGNRRCRSTGRTCPRGRSTSVCPPDIRSPAHTRRIAPSADRRLPCPCPCSPCWPCSRGTDRWLYRRWAHHPDNRSSLCTQDDTCGPSASTLASSLRSRYWPDTPRSRPERTASRARRIAYRSCTARSQVSGHTACRFHSRRCGHRRWRCRHRSPTTSRRRNRRRNRMRRRHQRQRGRTRRRNGGPCVEG